EVEDHPRVVDIKNVYACHDSIGITGGYRDLAIRCRRVACTKVNNLDGAASYDVGFDRLHVIVLFVVKEEFTNGKHVLFDKIVYEYLVGFRIIKPRGDTIGYECLTLGFNTEPVAGEDHASAGRF